MPKKSKEGEPKPVNRLETFKIVQINRKDIQGAEYNPRKISEEDRKKLRKSLQTHGMVQPIIVNKRTGNIVGGHQRINAMDSLLRKNDYELTVSMIDVSKEDEVKLNVSLNNIEGEWDIDKLEAIKIELPEIDFESDFGFDQFELESMFFDSEVFFPQNISDQVSVQNERNSVSSLDPMPPAYQAEDDEPESQNENNLLDQVHEVDKIKEAKKAYRDRVRAENQEGSSMQVYTDDYTLELIFNSNEEKWRFLCQIGKPISDTHIPSNFLYDLQSGKKSLTPSSKIGDNKVFVVFPTNSDKADFMKRMRENPKDSRLKPERLFEIENGTVDLIN